MSFGLDDLFEKIAGDQICFTRSKVSQCTLPQEGEMRGRMLTHVQESLHLGKYTGWIAKKIEKEQAVLKSFLMLSAKHAQGEFSETMPMVKSDGTYTVINTKEWLAKEKLCALTAAVGTQQWKMFETRINGTVDASNRAARLLHKINEKPCTSVFEKQEIEDAIRTVSTRSLAELRKGIAELKAFLETPYIFIHVCQLPSDFDPIYVIENNDALQKAGSKVHRKIEKALIQFERCLAVFEGCIQGMKALNV